MASRKFSRICSADTVGSNSGLEALTVAAGVEVDTCAAVCVAAVGAGAPARVAGIAAALAWPMPVMSFVMVRLVQ